METSGADAPSRKKCILVVDDEPGIRKMLSRIFSDGFKVLTAANGSEALEIARSVAVDLVILDVAMPGMDGYSVAELLRSERMSRSIPVLMLTSLSDPEDIYQAFSAGADCYMTKPFDPEELLLSTRSLLAAKVSE